MRNLFTTLLFVLGFIFIGYAQDLGQKNPYLISLKGNIYALEDNTQAMPTDIDSYKSLGTIYTQKLDVPIREFTQGFPGVTDRYEWFGLVYTGAFEIKKPGAYIFKTISDDGSLVWIDGKLVVDNDGVHGENPMEGEINLTSGMHTMKVWYYQGPANEIAMQLFIHTPDQAEGEFDIFDLNNYASKLQTAANMNGAELTPEGIKVRFDNVLFDTGKSILKPEADKTLTTIVDILKFYPNATVKIDGHTDIRGDVQANQVLSENRAKAVMEALKKRTTGSAITYTTQGFGSTRPVASGNSESDYAQNRRVEVLIIP